MAAQNTFLYNNARSLFATGALDWSTAEIHAVLVNAAYAPSLSDVNLSDVPSGAQMIDVTMTDTDQVNGFCFGTIPEFDAFLSASAVVALLIYSKGSDSSHSPLIYYSADGMGFPFTPQGFNYSVAFDQTARGFFQV